METIYAGIIKIENDKIKMLYIKKENTILDIRNYTSYKISEKVSIELETPLNEIIETFNLKNKTPNQLYETLLQDANFIYKNCNYFGIRKLETGYKYITRYVKMFDEEFNSKIFYDLEKIIKTPDTIPIKSTIKRFVRTRFKKK